jgi:hypothetical protein
MHIGGLTARVSAAWGTANLALFVPVPCNGPFKIKRVAWENGSTASGNVDMGVYTAEGKLVVSSGSTAQGTVNVQQVVDVTDTDIPPGLYYLALALSSATGTISGPAWTANVHRALGCYQMASAFPLPASATFADSAFAFYPAMHATTVDVI